MDEYAISFTRNQQGTVISATLKYTNDVVYNIVFTLPAFDAVSDSNSCSYPSLAGVEFLPVIGAAGAKGESGQNGRDGVNSTSPISPSSSSSVNLSNAQVAAVVVGGVMGTLLLAALVAALVTKFVLMTQLHHYTRLAGDERSQTTNNENSLP